MTAPGASDAGSKPSGIATGSGSHALPSATAASGASGDAPIDAHSPLNAPDTSIEGIPGDASVSSEMDGSVAPVHSANDAGVTDALDAKVPKLPDAGHPPPVEGGTPGATCDFGYYWDALSSNCEAWTKCQAGEYVDAKGSSEANTACTACPSQTFSEIVDAEACLPCDSCGWLGADPACSKSRDAACKHVDVTHQFGTSDAEWASDLAVDGAGNVWIVGSTFGLLAGDSVTWSDAFVQRVRADGSMSSTMQFGSEYFDYVHGVALDALGDVWVVGETSGALSGSSAGGYDSFVRVYEKEGIVRDAFQFGSTADDGAVAIAADLDGNVAIAGYTYGELNGVNAGESDAFVRVYRAGQGTPETYQFGTAKGDSPTGVAIDSDGVVWVAGYTAGDISGHNAGGTDFFVRGYSPDGSVLTTKQFGSVGDDAANGIAIDSQDSVWVVGETTGDLFRAHLGAQDGFAMRLPANDAAPTRYQFSLGSSTKVTGIAIDSDDNVWIYGTASAGLFVYEIPASGEVARSYEFGADSESSRIAVDAFGHIFVAGQASADLDGSGPGTYFGGQDAFARQIALPLP